MKKIGVFAIAFVIASLLFLKNTGAQSLNADTGKEGILIKEGDRKVLFYQKSPKSYEGKYKRNNYIHPLYALNGEQLTEDFPADHLHQRGIFWAWHQVSVSGDTMGDMWLAEDFIWDIKSIDITRESGKLTLHPVIYWKSPELRGDGGSLIPFMKESTRITVYPRKEAYRIIDFTIRLNSRKDSVCIGGADNVKGYGGFSARIKLPEDINFTADYGEVTPKRTPVKASKWMDFTGTFSADGRKRGIIIFSHPQNPAFPPEWILRKQGSMQNPVYPGKDPVLIQKSEPVTLHYRVLVHDGKLNDSQVKQVFMDFKQSTN